MPSLIEQPAPTPPADPAAALESILESMIATHEQMLAIAGEHRTAIARADATAVQSCVSRQGVLAARAAELEMQRRTFAASLGRPAAAPAIPTITALAQTLPEPSRPRILALAARLREVLLKLQRENRILRSATESLLAHMDGLVQQVARALSNTRLYSPQGRIDTGGPVPCGIDLTH